MPLQGFVHTPDGQPTPALSFRKGVTLAVSTTHAEKALPTDAAGGVYSLVTVRALDVAVYAKLGTSPVVTTADAGWDFYLDPGEEKDMPVRATDVTLSAITASGTGSLLIMGRE